MHIAVLGTGMVGRALAARLHGLEHQVTVGTRDPETTLARAYGSGALTFREWLADHEGVGLETFADAAAASAIVINATSGAAALDILVLAGEDNLNGKVLVDIANPLEFADGATTLFVSGTDSLGERIQRAFPKARVVKTLNTLNADLMVRPRTLPEGSSVFVSGDDAEAKAAVTALLKEFGHTDVIDLGDITTARGTEMLLPLWLQVWGALGTSAFNFKIIR